MSWNIISHISVLLVNNLWHSLSRSSLINHNISINVNLGENHLHINSIYYRGEGTNKQCNSTIEALDRVRHYNSCYWRIKLNTIRNGFQKQAPGVMCSPSSEYYSVIRSGCWIFYALWNHIRARCVSGRARLRRYIIMQRHQHNGHPFKCLTFSKCAQPSATYPATAFGRNLLTCHTHRREWMLNTKLWNKPLIHNYYRQFKMSLQRSVQYHTK